MTQKVRSNVYLDTELKELAREMFKNYGLSLSDGINFLLKQATEKKTPILDLNIEQINPNDSDYKLIEKARSNRANGEKVINIQGDSYRLKEKRESNINSDIYKFGAKSSTKIVEKVQVV
ncbi:MULTISPECIES: hypothetical protein [Aliarcobacter]|jgi:antitoxin component of RelBE/YafQ-DinJ toxin-antitoxin module|uniref:hypothetical protein n=1 Tax=Aliarcobacter TaxID=2321111 RepID=UPI00112F5967|nr:hypothetical protein [Aliarcobacter cryaerophilus]